MNRVVKLRISRYLRRLLVGWNKADLINRIAELRGYRSYLEISTAATGFLYGEIDRRLLTTCHRMMYRRPPQHSDGFSVDFAIEGLDTSKSIHKIRALGNSYDIILVDPWHEYATSFRDLGDAMSLLSEDGIVIVHDCLPPLEQVAAQTAIEGVWCGVTYRAFLDFVIEYSLDYRTVDIDYGCGAIRNRPGTHANSYDHAALLEAWSSIRDDEAFQFMQRHRSLWNVVQLHDFLREEASDSNGSSTRSGHRVATHDAPRR